MTRSQSLALRMGLKNYISTAVSLSADSLADVNHICGGPIKATTKYQYAKFPSGTGMQVVDTRAPHTDPTGVRLSYGGTLTDGLLQPHRVTTQPYSTQADESEIFENITTGVNMAVNQLGLSRLSRLKTVLEANATASAAIATSNAATEVVSLLQTEILNVIKASGGPVSIHILWGPVGALGFGNHAKVQGRITGGSNRQNPASLTMEQIDGLLNLGTKSKMSTAVYNSANIGATASNDFLIGNGCYIAAVSQTPNKEDPGAVKLFLDLKGSSGETFSPVFGSPHSNGLVEEATFSWQENIEVPNAAALIKVAFT
jgi:hypothetical protein